MLCEKQTFVNGFNTFDELLFVFLTLPDLMNKLYNDFMSNPYICELLSLKLIN